MVVTLLTDYGRADEFVGVCHGVIRRIAPDVPIVDVTHGIVRHGIRHGAVVLANALPYLPVGVHVAVVDPQVGTERRALAVRCADGRMLIGPDNGVLSLAWERAGGAVEAVDVSRSQHRLEPVSATFHGRDVFAPVAAHLASGAAFAEAGDPLDPAALTTISLPRPEVGEREALCHAVVVDGYGNVALDLRHEHLLGMGLTLGARFVAEVGGQPREGVFVQTFADVPAGQLLLYEDAWDAVALAVNRGDAAAELGLAPDDELRIAPAP